MVFHSMKMPDTGDKMNREPHEHAMNLTSRVQGIGHPVYWYQQVFSAQLRNMIHSLRYTTYLYTSKTNDSGEEDHDQ